ncbi:MAG TPA: YegS/Rv2252/BmrU family lipid kinase [Chitinophagaceae bacterium]
MKRIALICNPTDENQKALRIADTIALTLKAKGISYALFTSYWPSVLDEFTEVWISGGDGTLNHFINQHPGTTLPLTLFEGGSGNDFHWMLYGDIAVEKQIEKVLEGNIKRIDAGMCNGQLFLNGVGIGFDGAIVKNLLGKRKLAGKTAYLLSILKNIFSYREEYCELKLRDRFVAQDCFMISVANGRRYGGSFHVAPRALLQDGLLDISIIGKIAPVNRIRYLPMMEKGEHLELPFVHYYQSGTAVIECKKELPAHIDGEYVQARRYEIEVLPNKFAFYV